ncbi:carbamoyltransferase [Alphaproteobacteria bacterium]|nr:carbamoyltransferase [Alphaproteobacteria bacterium]
MYILGISAYYHDSASVILNDQEIVAAAQEERFTRIKHDPSFPKESIKYCLEEANITLEELSYIAFYDKPLIKFERLLETYLNEAPAGFKSFIMSMPIWLKEKLFLKETLARKFRDIAQELKPNTNEKTLKEIKKKILTKLMFAEHHQSHSSSAFFPSPFEESAILTIDGVGEWTTTSICYGKENSIKILNELHFPHSLGLLYSAFTYFAGFKVNSGEYKLMGLAPYGNPIYSDLIKKNIIDIKSDGSFKLNLKYFNYTRGLTMTSNEFNKLFKSQPRKPESTISQKEMDIAASIQEVTEEIVIKQARFAKKITGSKNLCLAGGVALNCVANGKLYNENIFDNIWIQPAAGDAGGALGAAYSVYYEELNNKRNTIPKKEDKMKGSYLGPKYENNEIKEYLDRVKAEYIFIKNEDELINIVSNLLAKEKVIGWHSGRMEFGPRALGNRSIIGDPRSNNMQSIMNLKIKFRESFRPFAPSIIMEKVNAWYEFDSESPYMLFVAKIKKNKYSDLNDEEQSKKGFEKLKIIRSKIPAVTHIDYSARIQTVNLKTNRRYYKLLLKFEEITDCPNLINTSFNVRGEPIVCTPEDSYNCFMRTEMDVLVINNYILYKEKQPKFNDSEKWKERFKLD